eukprot:scaffold2908_cov105-Isochrysis_galbana.AAC.10
MLVAGTSAAIPQGGSASADEDAWSVSAGRGEGVCVAAGDPGGRGGAEGRDAALRVATYIHILC